MQNGYKISSIVRLPQEVKNCEVQTELTRSSIDKLESDSEHLKSMLSSTRNLQLIESNDSKTAFYTGLHSWAVFKHLLEFLSPHVRTTLSLSITDELLLVLLRLRLGLLMEDVADRFGISISTASKIFQKWLDVMYVRLRFMIKWPSREVARQNLPPAFKQSYPNCVCIIDCSEVFIETPTSFEARSKTYSNYKKHNTIKFLIGITQVFRFCQSVGVVVLVIK